MGKIPLKTVIIDDSDVHRTLLKHMIEQHPNLKLCGSYRSGIEARNHQCEKAADLIILDVEMPFINGFDLLESFGRTPQIIMVSARADHALKAFDYDVTDYLLKPFEVGRFNTAIKRVLRHMDISIDKDDKYIFVRSNFREVRVEYKEILWVEALGDYIKLVTASKNILVLTSMKAFALRLPEHLFMRIHKSYIINLKHIERFNNTVVEVNGKQMPISRKRKAEFLGALRV